MSSSKYKRFRRCILHIGTVKTGTKTIQDFFDRNEKWLAKQNICRPVMPDRTNASQWEFVAAVHSKPWRHDFGARFAITDNESQLRFRENLVQSLRATFDAAKNADTLLISSEHFQSRLTAIEDIYALQEFLKPWVDEFEIIVYFRRQDQLALSFISTRMKSNASLNNLDVISFMNRTAGNYDHLGIYERWSTVFGQENIKVRLFEPEHWYQGDLLADFCETCGFEAPPEQAQTLNRSLDRRGFQFLNAFNAMYPISAEHKIDEERRGFTNSVSKLCEGKYYPISKTEAQAFYDQFKTDNATLKEIAFPDLDGPLFNEDFSEYPDTAESLEPLYGDAISIAYELWRDTHNYRGQRQSLTEKILRLFQKRSSE
ncbi:MAG: hypothetical protein NXH72_04185 [Hyphomonadaceae bacterium]|nr:hypothetical protein [Hyphomonadaceae bacterium]